jgi:predicted SAM-dependent methyltransferase/ADP-heptose:LPS heptosyltransferase
MTWNIADPQGNEAAKISWEIVKWTRGRGLDIGAGMYRTFPHFITVDNNADARLFGHNMPRPDLFVPHAAELGLLADGCMDFVFSSHLLEHIEEDRLVKVIREWWRVVKLQGFMVLYLPDEDEYPKVGEEGANPDHKWNVNYNAVMKIMHAAKVPFDLMDFQKRNEGTEYSLYFVFQKVAETPQHWHHDRPRPAGKTCGLVRYGAIGDSLQAASVFAGLKEQGYHLTLYCAEGPGYEVIKTDPHVDEFYIQGRGQVPDQALPSFWAHHAKKFDLWVNLSESVEGGLLAMQHRPVDTYSPHARHVMLNHNYVERQHLIAGLPDGTPHRIHFYATEAEQKWAQREKAAFGEFVVLWALTGSSVHKVWPWLDNVVSGLLIDFPELSIVLVGGDDGVILEKGWEEAPRVHRRSGKYSIRESLALAQVCDVIIGPETGVLNAVAMESMPKVIFLSHSTEENLTKHWVNTHALASLGTVCKGRGNDEAPACHRMHYSFDRCTEAAANPLTENLYKRLGGKRSGAGVAQCQYDIGPQEAYRVIWHVVQWQMEAYAKRDGRDPPGVVELNTEQLRALRAKLPAHLRSPAEVTGSHEHRLVIEA